MREKCHYIGNDSLKLGYMYFEIDLQLHLLMAMTLKSFAFLAKQFYLFLPLCQWCGLN